MFFRIDNCNGFFVLLHDNYLLWQYVESENLYAFVLGKGDDKTIYVKAETIKVIDVDAGRIEIVL